MQSALIIGCGYVGVALAHLLHAHGVDVTATTKRSDRLAEVRHAATKAVLWQSDDLQGLITLLQGKNCVIVTVAAHGPDDYVSTYLKTAQTLKLALESAPSVTQVIYTSSTSVYGERQGQWVNEEDSTSPTNPQTTTLVETEQVMLSLQTPNRNVCILRLGEIVGPSRSLPDRIGQRLGMPFPGTGQNYTNLIHRDDVVDAMVFAADSRLSGLYNLCNDLHITRKELYDIICDTLDWPMVSWDDTQKSLHGGNKRVSCDKIRTAGFILRYPDMNAVWS